jgi:hypothetical protein
MARPEKGISAAQPMGAPAFPVQTTLPVNWLIA